MQLVLLVRGATSARSARVASRTSKTSCTTRLAGAQRGLLRGSSPLTVSGGLGAERPQRFERDGNPKDHAHPPRIYGVQNGNSLRSDLKGLTLVSNSFIINMASGMLTEIKNSTIFNSINFDS